MHLVQAGVPWQVAEEMSPARRIAVLVIAGEAKGATFDWDRMKWVKQD